MTRASAPWDKDPPVVVHVMQSTAIGGAERHLLSLLPALRNLGWDVRFWGFTTDSSSFADAMAATGIPTELYNVKRMRSLAVARELRRYVRASGVRIVHSHLYYADIHTQIGLLGTGVRSVRTVHNGPEFFRQGRARRVYGWVGYRADRTITVSEHMATLAPRVGFAPPHRIRVVPHGVDVSAWGPALERRSHARHALGMPEDALVVVCTSRLIPNKGQDTLIRAFAKARRQNEKLRLVIAGSGPEEERLRRLAQRLLAERTYLFTGFVSDVRHVVWAADVFVFPTHAEFDEGFGIAALEAAAAEVPVIATDHAPLLELIEHDRTGLIVRPGAEEDLARAIARLAADRPARERLAAAAAERVRSRFTRDAMASATAGVYDELLGRR